MAGKKTTERIDEVTKGLSVPPSATWWKLKTDEAAVLTSGASHTLGMLAEDASPADRRELYRLVKKLAGRAVERQGVYAGRAVAYLLAVAELEGE